MSKSLQRILQLIFLGLFIALIALGRVQLWVGIFLISFVGILFFSRFYCGWICPINSVMRVVTWAKKKLKIKSFKIPEWIKNPAVRIAVVLLFIGVFAFSMISGKRLPVLPILFALGILLTFFFPEELWHRYLCPYGTLMTIPGRFSKLSMKVDQDNCTSCNACLRVCPAGAVDKEGRTYDIVKKDCILCMDCSRACKGSHIRYH